MFTRWAEEDEKVRRGKSKYSRERHGGLTWNSDDV